MGVDPGVNGGIAVLGCVGDPVLVRGFRSDMTETDLDKILQIAAEMLLAQGDRFCFIEKVGYMRGDGGQGAFTFGKIFGLLRGGLRAYGVELVDVYPATWQGALECLSGGNKNVTKKKAMELFPNEKITHAVADALLIAYYGQRRLASLSRANPQA